MLFVSCLFGISFIILGNMAGNCINFSVRAFEAAGIEEKDQSSAVIRGVSIAVATFACFIHAISRRGGILLNNVFAVVKAAFLLVIIITAIVFSTGAFGTTIDQATSETIVTSNLAPSKAFASSPSDANGYARAFLSISECDPYLGITMTRPDLLITRSQFLHTVASSSQTMLVFSFT